MHGWSRIELAPLLQRRVFSSTQQDETRARVSEALKDHRLTWKGGRVDAELNRGRFGSLTVCTLRYGAEVHIEPDRLQDFMLVQVPLRGRARIECGDEGVNADPDCAAVIAPNRRLRLHWEAGCEQLLLKIPRGKLEAMGQRAFGDAAAGPLDFTPALRLDTPIGAAWRSMMTSLIHLLPTLDDGARRPPAAWLEHLEDTLVLHLLYNQPNTWQTQAGQPNIVPRRLSIAETYMRERLGAPLTLNDIARHAGASATALTRLFQEHRNTTPMNALRAFRLDAARTRLKTQPDASVTEVALSVGFGHLGRFSEYYRERFGELPRETRRAAG
ncbi:MAG: AraC family transcriptional regulator [Achromobacter mucicolens]|jgi:AraC-like DNA-binding protein|uniref:AraC family transcriptional regulator n=1 Tax=Achromobacter mucicolens TaxID=1389922 RepID=UPI00146797F9|nr:AraC family transcriptional regulator [Achromobacter mucicolens]MDF2864868.1 AraC family transcriptional regulator [Achromobacter mucicolens]CAB3918099.1 HTH-type transcriptional activator RhaS [Achromobacter mucicolens]